MTDATNSGSSRNGDGGIYLDRDALFKYRTTINPIVKKFEIPTEDGKKPDVPEYVYYRAIPSVTLDDWETRHQIIAADEEKGATTEERAKAMHNVRASLVTIGLCDATGKKTHGQPGDEQALGELPGFIIKPLYEAIAELNGMRKKDVDAAVKNSESAPESERS